MVGTVTRYKKTHKKSQLLQLSVGICYGSLWVGYVQCMVPILLKEQKVTIRTKSVNFVEGAVTRYKKHKSEIFSKNNSKFPKNQLFQKVAKFGQDAK